MAKIRVLVVDDAVVIRKILTDVISEDNELEVVGTAANGKIALQKIPQVNPDIITLDVEMPEMNGLETVKHIKKDYPKIPVIMFSTLTERGASATLEALSNGAADYVTKPANVGSVNNAREAVREDLIRKIKSLTRKISVQPAITSSLPGKSSATAFVSQLSSGGSKEPINIVTIGVSTGGPNALADIMPHFPADFPVPIVLVQHMPPMFTKLLADRLNAQSPLQIVEATEGMLVKPGMAIIAPGGYHLELKRAAVGILCHLQQEPPENSCRPAVDVLFRSVVSLYGKNTLGVILTGMGSDGLRGCELIKEVGGRVLAQDQATSVVWGMPGYVADAGLADSVLPLTMVPQEIIRLVGNPAKDRGQQAIQAR